MIKKKSLLINLSVIGLFLLILLNGCGKAKVEENDNDKIIARAVKTSTVTDIDGNVYKTVIIGNQEWMAENLRVTRDAAGKRITRYCYDNDVENCGLYGGIYTWNTVANGESINDSETGVIQGICPAGWHVPADEEWVELTDFLTDNYRSITTNNIGSKLKSCRQEGSPYGGDCDTDLHPRWNSRGTHYGTDDFGFSALPGGYRDSNGKYFNIGRSGYWWTSSETSFSTAWYRGMFYYADLLHRSSSIKDHGFYLRCVRI